MNEAALLYLKAKDFLSQRINHDSFFGNLSIMKWLIDDLYTIIELDYSQIDFFDLYYVLKKPVTVTFYYDGEKYSVSSEVENGGIAVYFNNKRYESIDDFFARASIRKERLTEISNSMYLFKVKEKGRAYF